LPPGFARLFKAAWNETVVDSDPIIPSISQVGSFLLVSRHQVRGRSSSALYGSRNKAKKKHKRQQEESKSVFEPEENVAGMDQVGRHLTLQCTHPLCG
jgi:hypothetical protein